MGRPTDLTFELFSAADKLKSQNAKTNAKTVHTELGLGGSLATAYKLFKEWKTARSHQSPSIDSSLDQSVTRAINNLLANKRQEAIADANQRLAEMHLNVDMFISENERLEFDLEAKVTEFTVVSEQNSLLAGRIFQLEADAMRSAAELANERLTVESARLALAKSELRLEAVPRIETELDQIRLDLLQARTQSAELHEIAAVATAKLESEILHRKDNEIHVAEAVRQREELAELRAELASIKTMSK